MGGKDLRASRRNATNDIFTSNQNLQEESSLSSESNLSVGLEDAKKTKSINISKDKRISLLLKKRTRLKS